MAMIFVTHDLGVAIEISHHLAVMYAGRFVETGTLADIVRRPRHPYTEGLMGSTVHEVPKGTRLMPIPGSPPNLAALPPGCSFAPRCSYVEAGCGAEFPPPLKVQPGSAHVTRCYFPERVGSARLETTP